MCSYGAYSNVQTAIVVGDMEYDQEGINESQKEMYYENRKSKNVGWRNV